MSAFSRMIKQSDNRLVQCVDQALNHALLSTQVANSGFYTIDGMSGYKYRHFINTLVHNSAANQYLEVGSWMGSTLCSAIHGNRVRAVAIDNWSLFGGPKDAFIENVRQFQTEQAEVFLIEGDFRQVDYRNMRDVFGTFNIYLFDGPHEEQDQFDGLQVALPCVDDVFVFIVDDWNWEPVRTGTKRAIQAFGLEPLYAAEIRTSMDNSHGDPAGKESAWHNGYFISVLKKGEGAPAAPVETPIAEPKPTSSDAAPTPKEKGSSRSRK